MFENKSALRHLLHEKSNLISGGILEISSFHNAEDCPPLLPSLGKRLSFDNTLVDVHSLGLHLTENTTADQLINAVNVLHG